jgi:hypothetical protein
LFHHPGFYQDTPNRIRRFRSVFHPIDNSLIIHSRYRRIG